MHNSNYSTLPNTGIIAKLRGIEGKELKDKAKLHGIQDHSKKIKKDKKAIKSETVPSTQAKGEIVALEEGEEDPNAEQCIAQSNQLSFDLEERPSETLINEYAKFPLYIEARV